MSKRVYVFPKSTVMRHAERVKASGAGKVAISADHVVIYPAPELYLLPADGKAFVYTRWTGPGGPDYECYTLRRYSVNWQRNSLPEKYRKMLYPVYREGR